MSCLTLKVNPVAPASLGVNPVGGARLSVAATPQPKLSVNPKTGTSLSVAAKPQPTMSVSPMQKATLTIGEVCSVGGGTMVVLAASDGPLRTKDGGYFLLNPATNPSET